MNVYEFVQLVNEVALTADGEMEVVMETCCGPHKLDNVVGPIDGRVELRGYSGLAHLD